jgi:hypothetical protein
MKIFIILLLLMIPVAAQAQESDSICPIKVLNVLIKRPSVYSSSRYDKPSLEISFTNLTDKPIIAITFEVEFWDSRHERSADKIKGFEGSTNPKDVILKPLQKKTISHSLYDYYPLESWSTSAERIKIKNVLFADKTLWLNEDK